MSDGSVDVIVFGGGSAGTTAAIQAARAGARTLLVEKNAMMGGTTTVGGINCPSRFFAKDRQIIRGIGWELVCKTYAEQGMGPPESNRINVNVALFAAVADEAALEAGVDLLYHAMPAAVRRQEQRWRVDVCTRTGIQPFDAKVLIDATGDAAVVGLAGFERMRSDVVQPATLSFRCSGYDVEALDHAALEKAAQAAIERGELRTTDLSWHNQGPKSLLSKRGRNANHVPAPEAHTSEGRTRAEIEGRRALLRMYRFLRRQPGLEAFEIDSVCAEIGVRETLRIKGKKTITVEEYETGVLYDDALCYAYYPVDEHLHDGKGVRQRALKAGVLPTIPRGALLPEGSQFLIAAGRCLSSDREANTALRVQCPCMAMGQAAGAMAALSARDGVDPEMLPMDDIRSLLREHDAIVP